MNSASVLLRVFRGYPSPRLWCFEGLDVAGLEGAPQSSHSMSSLCSIGTGHYSPGLLVIWMPTVQIGAGSVGALSKEAFDP